MLENDVRKYIEKVVNHVPAEWVKLTTHRLDIYNEKLAKTEFINHFELLYESKNSDSSALKELPTAFDYIRLGHPLSCVLEWAIAKSNNFNPNYVISFSSRTAPILAVLRKNLFDNKPTRIAYTEELPSFFNVDLIRAVYGYNFELIQVALQDELPRFDGSTVFISQSNDISNTKANDKIDFLINFHKSLGSVLLINKEINANYISEIQHVRRRESIAMTPTNCLAALKKLTTPEFQIEENVGRNEHKSLVFNEIIRITGATSKPLVASSGLSIQYAILMGLIDDASENHPGKPIKIVVPPNCYGGTNDQARRVAACLDNVEILDLPVDGGNDMVQSIDTILDKIAQTDSVPFIIAEIPTNPRVEVPDLNKLRAVLSKSRQSPAGERAIEPVFILDQTFCPNVHFVGETDILSNVRTVSFASGSKFPSGGLCTAGYCVANSMANSLMKTIEKHLILCDNEATEHQIAILSKQLPSMLQRIQDAYLNTSEFVRYINEILPEAKINFVSEELAEQGFTPSVFSLDLPTKGNNHEEKEAYKRALNLKLIKLMISEIPDESKYCVSYGQLKGCYWTIPATSTQGTTKEGDKDYIARVALSPDLDLELHKKVFSDFVNMM